MTAKIETISITLTHDEAYALCNKLSDEALITHGGYCEFDQIKLLQRVGKEIGALVGHAASHNDLSLDVKASVRPETKTSNENGWISWRGGKCPFTEVLNKDITLSIRIRAGSEYSPPLSEASSFCWRHWNGKGDIVAFKLESYED